MEETVPLSINIHPMADQILRSKAREIVGPGSQLPLGEVVSELIFGWQDWGEIAEEVRPTAKRLARRKRDRDRKKPGVR